MAARETPDRGVAVFLHGGDYDRLHQGAAIAAAAVAAGRPVQVFFFWWALRRFLDGALDRPEFPPAEGDLAHRFEARGWPTAAALLASARETGRCRVHACSASLEMLGLRPNAVHGLVDSVLGWTGILARTEGVVDRFYL